MVEAARPRVFVARLIPEEGLAKVRAACDSEVWPDELPPPRDELLRRVAGCDGRSCLDAPAGGRAPRPRG